MGEFANVIATVFVLGVVIAGPVLGFVLLRDRLSRRIGKLGLAVALSAIAGAFVAYARSLGWKPVLRSGHALEFPPEVGFAVVGAGVLVVLLLQVFHTEDRPRAAVAAVDPPDRERPAEQAEPEHRRRRTYRALLAIYGLGLLVWPFASIAALFVLGDPKTDKLLALYPVSSIWAYPLYFWAGHRLGDPRRNPTVFAVSLRTSVPLLSALWWYVMRAVSELMGLGS
ncbi:MAG: hypothetical protein KDC87_19440 [Planctomycetes bacterium]|nr:hypothetical protein [Planctomycetota bacterium]MCB9868626.1 hypothetical protein [Planctomycetota bacterium]MCB9889210.1 hypothetical protein [Planctomycetota bacterium]